MGNLAVYLLPELGPLVPSEYAERVEAVLLELGIIDSRKTTGFQEMRGPGGQSLAPFANDGGWRRAGFEWCIIYGSDRKSLVPTDPAVSPRCPACNTDVTDEYYETVNDAVEFEPDKPDEELRLRCHKCGGEYCLDQLVDDVGIFLVNAFVNFDDISGSLRSTWLSDFDQRVGLRHRCLEYGYT